MDDESRESLEEYARDAGAIHSMVNTVGWKDIVRPALNKRKDALIGELCNCEVQNFVKIQQGVNAIDNLIEYIEFTLIEGKRALNELRDAEHA